MKRLYMKRNWKNVGRKLHLILLMLVILFTASLHVEAVDIAIGTSAGHIDISEILTEEEIALMQEQEVYIVGYIEDFSPLSYVNEEGEICGSAVDVWEAIAEILDIEYQYVEASVENISDGSVDIYLTRYAPDGIIMEQKSDSYYLLNYVYIHGELYAGDASLPVGALSYFELTEADIEDWLGGSEVIVYDTFADMNKAFNNGEIQSMILTSARFNNVKESITVEYTVDILDGNYECCLSYENTFSEEKIAIINKIIGELDDTTIAYSILEHSTYTDTSILGVIAANPTAFAQIIFVIAIFILVFILIIYAVIARQRKRKLEYKLKTDALTGLVTGTYFEEQMREILDNNPGKKYTVFSFDVDNFKYINEIYGHGVGNDVLHRLGEHLVQHEPSAKLEARFTADQFVALVETKAINKEFFQMLEQKFQTDFTSEKHGLGNDFRFSFSLGYYHIVDPNMEVSNIINCARMGKELGKNIVGYTIFEFTPEMAIERANNNQVVAAMNSAVEHKEFVVYYQPKVDLQTNKIVGAEALVRWVRDGKLIAPYKFIPVFEKNGFIETIDTYVLTEVCRFIKEHGKDNIPVISVNLSTVSIMSPCIVDKIKDTVASYELEPMQIDLEITESALVDKTDQAIDKIKELRNMGFTIAMDDFGVGTSSLSQLKKIPLDILKIDRGFVIDALTDDKGAAIVSHIVLMAQDLQLQTVAEGIETKAQEQFFRNLGCDIGQGYYYSRPVLEREFLAMLKKENQ